MAVLKGIDDTSKGNRDVNYTNNRKGEHNEI
jgi:hypothetical protein